MKQTKWVLDNFLQFSIKNICCGYRKTPKNLDTRKIYCNNPKILSICIFHRKMCLNHADGMANSVAPEQSAQSGVYTVCSDPSILKFWNITLLIRITSARAILMRTHNICFREKSGNLSVNYHQIPWHLVCFSVVCDWSTFVQRLVSL